MLQLLKYYRNDELYIFCGQLAFSFLLVYLMELVFFAVVRVILRM